MFPIVGSQERIGRQHVEQAVQSARQRQLPRWPIRARFPAAQPRQQLHALPLQGHPIRYKKPAATHAKATNMRMPSRSSNCTSSQPKHSLVNLKLSSTPHRWRYI